MPPITPYPIPPSIPQNSPMKVAVTFKDGNGAKFDPDSEIAIVAKDPKGNVTTYDSSSGLSHDDTGDYSVIVEATIGGDWIFRGQGKLADGKLVSTPDVLQYVEPSSIA